MNLLQFFRFVGLIVLLFSSVFSKANSSFDDFFFDKSLRINYSHCGNDTSDYYYFENFREEPYWAGSKSNLIDDTGYGNYMIEVYNAETESLIFSIGFCTLFGEWQTVPEAKKISKCFRESVVIPFPKEKVEILFLNRTEKGTFVKKYSLVFNPDDYFIKKDRFIFPVYDISVSGDPHDKVDLVLLAEGYTKKQQKEFLKDCKRFIDLVFAYEPYKSNKQQFNVRAVWVASKEEGADIPGQDIWKETYFDASYYTFDSERYLMVEDYQMVRDVASNAPYDFIYILSNTEKYGGGAIYNFYGISASKHKTEAGKIFVHEFGHLFAGLGDEYVGGVEYSDLYPAGVEPWEPNLTTLTEFNKKWQNMIQEGVQIPTPVDSSSINTVGVYEGGGYVEKGVYRPAVNCMMNNFHTINTFCPVCQSSIQKIIDHYCSH